MIDTPAAEYWTLYVEFIDASPRTVPISFLPTGEIDWTRTQMSDMIFANSSLAPTTRVLQSITGDENFDIWRLFNWFFVSWYWVFLADFGQTAPSIYTQGGLNLSFPIVFPATNNIFINKTLFEIYYSYLQTTILPILQYFQPDLVIPSLLPVSDGNQLLPVNTCFLRSYSCLQRQIKGWASATISVLVANYTLIIGPYSFIAFIAGWLQKRKDEGIISTCIITIGASSDREKGSVANS